MTLSRRSYSGPATALLLIGQPEDTEPLYVDGNAHAVVSKLSEHGRHGLVQFKSLTAEGSGWRVVQLVYVNHTHVVMAAGVDR